MAHQDVLYEVTFASQIAPDISFLRNVGDVGSEDSLYLDARGSRFVSHLDQSNSGLTYRWKCQENFQQYCDLWEGSPVLYIPNSVVQLYGYLNTYYSFSVVVTSLQQSNASFDSDLSFKLGD